jgi:hypothetical protein
LLLGCIKYIIKTEYLALKLRPNAKGPSFEMKGIQDKDGRAEMEGVSDSKFGSDKETRISIFGWNLYFCGAMIAWKSKASNSVTLSPFIGIYLLNLLSFGVSFNLINRIGDINNNTCCLCCC